MLYFTFPWEQRKLGEIAKYQNGKAHEDFIIENGKYIVINSKFISTNSKIKKFSNYQLKPLYKNDIAFVLSDIPKGKALARTFLVNEDNIYTLNQRIAGITPLGNINTYFLYILMNRHRYFLRFDDGSNQTNLSIHEVLEFKSEYPNLDEQTQIGNFFQSFDTLITLHQCELTQSFFNTLI